MNINIHIDENEIRNAVTKAIDHHGKTRDALIPILSDVNRVYGYIPSVAYKEIKRQINLPDDDGGAQAPVFVSESQLFGLASFYQMISTKPVGKHVVRFCESAPCHVMGGRQLYQALTEQLQLEPGQTTPDGQWTFITTSCLGACGVGPVVLIDDDIYGNVTADQLPEILARYS